jgi:hypothetical protein
MEKLSTFNVRDYEFGHFATIAIKNAMAIQTIESRLNIMTEAINQLIDDDSSIDMEAFKASFLKELATLLNQNTEFEFSNSLFNLLGIERTELSEKTKLLEIQFQLLIEKISEIESILGQEKIEEDKKSNTSENTLETELKHMKIVLVHKRRRNNMGNILIAENVHPRFQQRIIRLLNENRKANEHFILKSNDHTLYKGIEDLI